jgi:parallel beta-helix repeat protein
LNQFKLFFGVLLLVGLLGLNIGSFGTDYHIDTELALLDNLGKDQKLPRLASQSSEEYLADNSTWEDYPVDDDGNGLYDRLVVDLGSPDQINEGFYVYGILKNSSGSWLGLSSSYIYRYFEGNITLSFTGQPINASGSDGQYEVWISTSTDSSEFNFSHMYTTASSYNHNDFESPSARIIDFSDYGSDTDGDSLIDEIVINVSISVKDSGYYTIAVLLGSDNPFTIESQTLLRHWSGSLNPGIENVEIRIPTYYFYSVKLNGPYTVGFAYLNRDISFQHFLTNAYNTSDYLYTDFDAPVTFLTGYYWDKGEDMDSDGKFDQIIIEVEVNVTQAGDYSLELFLRSSTPGTYFSRSFSGSWGEGVQNISVVIDDPSLYYQRLNTSYIINNIGIRDSNFRTIDRAYNTYTTRIYNYTEFDLPAAFLTGSYWDQGVDMDSDGKFDQLVIDVGVNVTQAGDYSLELSLSSSIPGTYISGSSSGSWGEGVQNVSVVIDDPSLYYQRLNTSYIINNIGIRDSNFRTNDRAYNIYTTRIYNYKEFDIPAAFLTGNYWDRGADTNVDGKFDQLVIDVEVNVTQVGDYSLELSLSSSIPGAYLDGSSSGYWVEGVQNVSVVIDDASLYYQRLNTSYIINDVGIHDSNYTTLDRVYNPYTTRIYNYSEFDVPDVLLTGRYGDRGADKNADGKFDQLVIDVEVNVTQAGDYSLELSLSSSTPGAYLYGSSSGYWIEGIQNVSAVMDTSSLYLNHLNTSYIVTNIRIFDSNYNTLEEAVYPYITRVYAFDEFDEVDAPIHIYGNDEFQATAIAQNWPGDGSSSAPYVIDGLVLSGTNSFIEIRNSDVYFQISNCDISYGYNGIYLYNVKNGHIVNNTIYNNDHGILLDNSNNCIIANNTLHDNDWGVSLWSSENNIIINNNVYNKTATGWDGGILLQTAKNNIISDNMIHRCFRGIILESSIHNTISNNKISQTDEDGIGLGFSDHNTIVNNTVFDNYGNGINHWDSNNNKISNNIIFNNHDGIVLSRSHNHFISNNTVYDCPNGITLWDSNHNIISNNKVYNCNGIHLWHDDIPSQNNTVTRNDLSSNNPWGGSQASDDGANNVFAYNYWSEWTSPDANGDGVVDKPYVIDGSANNQDRYPLVSLPSTLYLLLPIITSPNGGETLSGDTIISWTGAVDVWGHDVTYSIYYSSDGGTTWTPLETGLTATSYDWDTTTVNDGSNYLIKVAATCSEGLTNEDISDGVFTIQNIEPTTTTPPTTTPKTTTTTTTKMTSTIQPASGCDALLVLLSLFLMLPLRQFKKKS